GRCGWRTILQRDGDGDNQSAVLLGGTRQTQSSGFAGGGSARWPRPSANAGSTAVREEPTRWTRTRPAVPGSSRLVGRLRYLQPLHYARPGVEHAADALQLRK